MPKGVLTLDIETHSKDLLYDMPPEEFVRLNGYAWGNGPAQTTKDLEEIRDLVMSAWLIVGHNLHDFDLRAIFGVYSNTPMWLADQERVYDTFTHAALVNPIPKEYVDRFGTLRRAPAEGWSPEKALPWYGLDEQAHQLGVKGKTYDLKELAYEFGDPSLPKKERIDDGFGKIPIDDPRYVRYLIGDVEASREVGKALLKKGELTPYALREQKIASRAAAISSNGWRTHKERAQARSDRLRERREKLLAELGEKYGFPQEGEKPWLTNPGKNAIMAVLADHGICDYTNWPKTPRYAKKKEAEHEARECAVKAEELQEWLEKELQENPKFRRVKGTQNEIRKLEEKSVVPVWFGLSLAGETLINLTKGTEIEDLGKALGELMGQRSLADLALESTYSDGFVHPEITMLQRSGRWSTTKPGLTVWTDRGEGEIEKSYFIPDQDDHVLIEIDLSNADARVVAALSGDKAYAKRFEPGEDSHLHNAWAAWGRETVGTDKHNPETAAYRFRAKALGHGWNYGGQAKTLSQQAGVALEVGKQFCDGMAKAFHRVIAWQNRVRKEAHKGYVENLWGRRMPVEKGREFTQAPALMGQSGTREIMCDALLSMPYGAVRLIKAQIHDAFVFSVPEDRWEYYRDKLQAHMETSMNPKGGQYIAFPAECGPPGKSWMEAKH